MSDSNFSQVFLKVILFFFHIKIYTVKIALALINWVVVVVMIKTKHVCMCVRTHNFCRTDSIIYMSITVMETIPLKYNPDTWPF